MSNTATANLIMPMIAGLALDSLLQSTGQSLESGREMLAEMKEREETAVRQFTKVIETLELPDEPADQPIDS